MSVFSDKKCFVRLLPDTDVESLAESHIDVMHESRRTPPGVRRHFHALVSLTEFLSVCKKK